MMQLESIQDFVNACRYLDNDGIYETFEFDISDGLRGEIYEKYSNDSDVEPMRSAMNKIGTEFKVKSLYEY